MVASASGAAVYAGARQIESRRANAVPVGVDKIQEEKIVYNGLPIIVIGGFNNIEGFERVNCYMEAVDDEKVMEAVEMLRSICVGV
jgi:hypothetical protein